MDKSGKENNVLRRWSATRRERKEQMVQRCLQQAKEMRRYNMQTNRADFALHMRQTCRNVMVENGKGKEPPRVSVEEFGFDHAEMSGNEYEELLLMLQDIIEEEEQAYEEAMLRNAMAEEAEACLGLGDDILAQQESDVTVVCPICEANRLLQCRGVLFCPCGFRFDTQHDGISLQHVYGQLMDASREHGAACGHKPVFQVLERMGFKGLFLTCQCGAQLLVI